MFRESRDLFEGTWRKALWIWPMALTIGLLDSLLPLGPGWSSLFQIAGFLFLLSLPPLILYLQVSIASGPFYDDSRPLAKLMTDGLRFWTRLAVLQVAGFILVSCLDRLFGLLSISSGFGDGWEMGLGVFARTILFPYAIFAALNIVRHDLGPLQGIVRAFAIVPGRYWLPEIGVVLLVGLALNGLQQLLAIGADRVLTHGLVPHTAILSGVMAPAQWFLTLIVAAIWYAHIDSDVPSTPRGRTEHAV